MKKGLLLALAVLCCASFAFAQTPGSIAVYGSMTPTENCGVPEAAFASFYFYHVADVCATASEFTFDITGANYNPFGFIPAPGFQVLGNINTGIAITYGGAFPGVTYLGVANYGVLSPTPACTKLFVTKHLTAPSLPSSGPLAIDCGALQSPPVTPQWLYLRGSYVIMNPNETCPCTGTVPAEETSWGQIKSLYN